MIGLGPTAAVCAAAVIGCWLTSVLTREYSWVDRLWSVLPPIYAWVFAAQGGFAPRSVAMAALATAWGARLTFNFWRKGGYARGGEDYRWQILRERLPAWAWGPFNLGFVAGYQNLLIWAFTLPAAAVAAHPSPLGPLDLALGLAFVGLLAGETVADQQQWEFHRSKHAARAAGLPHPPFLTTGLFRWSRHPNFVCEMGQWWVFAGFTVAAGAGAVWPAWIGAALLTLLFDGSTRFTESISRSRYPAYAEYQRTTSRWLPWPPRP